MSRSIALLLLSVTALPSCSLTALLWAESGQTPPLIRSDAECRVHSIRGDFLAATSSGSLFGPGSAVLGVAAVDVEFSVHREQNTAVEVMDFTPENPGRLRLSPPDTEENWFALPGASLFEPRLWEFSVFRGNYFASRSSSVPVAFVGHLDPEQIGTLHRSADIPGKWRRLPRLPAGLRADANVHCLLADGADSFAQRDWMRLIGGETVFTERDAVPLAWLDDRGQVLTPAEMSRRLETSRIESATAEDLAKYTLLGRLQGAWGDPLYVRVPLPVLVQGEGLQLKRVGKKVIWQRRQVWTGTLRSGERAPPTADPEAPVATDVVAIHEVLSRQANSIPLVSNRFVYSYAQEDHGKSVLGTLFKYILTPPAVVLDFLIETSVFYPLIRRWMEIGTNREYQGPIGPGKKK